MAKATRVHSTPRTDSSDEPSKSDEHFASAFYRLEGDVCDLERMSEVAESLVAEWMKTQGSSPPREAELAVVAVQQLRRLLDEFKINYYSAWQSDKAVQS
jgi:hypothetical protein